MRLIDADEYKGKAICNHTYSGVKRIINIDDIPTTYDIDKVVEELETDSSVKLYGSGNSDNYLIPIKKAIKIVKQGGVSEHKTFKCEGCRFEHIKEDDAFNCDCVHCSRAYSDCYEKVVEWMKQTFNPCDECPYSFSKNNQESSTCKICEFKDYINAEKQGLILRLPCKVGDIIYEVSYENREFVIKEHIVKEFVYRKYRFPRIEIYCENENGFLACNSIGELDECLFLTQAEAEQKLKEMRGEAE